MMTLTCRLSNGDCSTGIKWLICGLDALILLTSNAIPATNSRQPAEV